jgi:hypothetical protein
MISILVYLTVASLVQTIGIQSNDWMIVDNELEIMSKEAVVAEFEAQSRCLHGETKENYEKPQDS